MKLPRYFLTIATTIALSLAGGTATAGDGQGKVLQIAINKDLGSLVFVRLDSPPVAPAACSTNGYWHFTLPLVSDLDKRLHAHLLAAKLANATVSISGTGICSEFGTVESAKGVGLL